MQPTAGELRFFPLAGRSVVPFTVAVQELEELEAPRGWRNLLTGPIGDHRFLRIAQPEGAIEIGVQSERLPWLLGVVDPGRPS